MGFYERFVIPRVTSWVCASTTLGALRQRVVPSASGRVVELGAGAGHNLPYYRAGAVERVWAVEPSLDMWRFAAQRLAGLRAGVEHVHASAEAIPLGDAVADTVVVTWALCSIPRPELALAEARRLLKPGGQLLFAEHGLAPEAGVRRWQRWLNPLWRRVSGGCNLDRDVHGLLAAAGFEVERSVAEYVPGPRLLSFNVLGVARPSRAGRVSGASR